MTQVDEIVDLKAVFNATEERGYNQGFVDAKNSMEPVVHQARTHGFGKGWLAALQTMGVVEDSPLRNPEQIRYPAPVPPV